MMAICSCKERVNPVPPWDVDAHLIMKAVDENGEDMLNPNISKARRYIRMYEYVNGEKSLILDPRYTAQFGYIVTAPHELAPDEVSTDSREFFSKVYKDWSINFNLSASECKFGEQPSNSRTLIEWDENTTDTIVTQFLRTEYAAYKQKIWINGELIWDLNRDGKLFYYTKILK